MKKYAIWIIGMLLVANASAVELSGTKTVTLHGMNGEKVVLGQLKFMPQGNATSFAFTPNTAAFGERFLAMRPFLCIDGPKDSLCHFPYKSPQRISMTDLTDLEYHFMFLQKPRASVSLDPANGVYYEMRYTEKGIEGKLREVDMAPIIIPEGDMTRPIKRENLFEVDLSSKWLPRLTIE